MFAPDGVTLSRGACDARDDRYVGSTRSRAKQV